LTDFFRDVYGLAVLRRVFPSSGQLGVHGHNTIDQGGDRLAVECWLDHSAVRFPKFPLAHHQAIVEQKTNPLARVSLYVILPAVTEDMFRMPWIPGYIDRTSIDGGFENVAETVELIIDPFQQVLVDVVLIVRFWGRSQKFLH
jgi:hypothetical protein